MSHYTPAAPHQTPVPEMTKTLKSLGAREWQRRGDHTFNLVFTNDEAGHEPGVPGNGTALVSELSNMYGTDAISWRGAQAFAISVNLAR